jgi:hypothetical protein
MSIETIQREIETWDAEDLRKLILMIASLRRRREDPARGVDFARLVDDNSPEQWVGMDEVNRRLAGE